MTDQQTLVDLASIAHRLWSGQMIRQGWRYGSEHDEERHVHDALVDFDQLGKRDRQHGIRAMEALDLESTLVNAIEYQRGPEREFMAEEMVQDLEVGWAKHVQPEDPSHDLSTERGQIESWEINSETGDLTKIFVRWQDGSLIEHYPSECDLRRID